MESTKLRIGWQRGAVELSSRRAKRAEETENPLAQLGICLVSENPFASRTIKQILQSVGIWGVAEQRTFKDAVKSLAERRFDLIIKDTAGADAKALAFVADVRASDDVRVSRLPVVAVIDGADIDGIKRVRDGGINAILLRPFSPKALMLRVKKALDSRPQFIRTTDYTGPCRRQQGRQLKSAGVERRAA